MAMKKTLSLRQDTVQSPRLCFGIGEATSREILWVMGTVFSSRWRAQSVKIVLIVCSLWATEQKCAVSNVKLHTIVTAIVRWLIGRQDTKRIASES